MIGCSHISVKETDEPMMILLPPLHVWVEVGPSSDERRITAGVGDHFYRVWDCLRHAVGEFGKSHHNLTPSNAPLLVAVPFRRHLPRESQLESARATRHPELTSARSDRPSLEPSRELPRELFQVSPALRLFGRQPRRKSHSQPRAERARVDLAQLL